MKIQETIEHLFLSDFAKFGEKDILDPKAVENMQGYG
jgi:hypothetical protein